MYVENEINIPSVVARQVVVALAIQCGSSSGGGGTWHTAWQPECAPWNPHKGRRREPTPESCPLTSTYEP